MAIVITVDLRVGVVTAQERIVMIAYINYAIWSLEYEQVS